MAEKNSPLTIAEAILEKTNNQNRGKLKLFLGAAPGVGKTYAMLTEAHEMLKEGLDVVIGLVETHNRKDTAKLLEGLEVIPRKKIEVDGFAYEELDVKAIIKRRPATVIIDEMPHTNVRTSVHNKRYQDIEELLDTGINVYSALNIQHLESLNDVVAKVTGVWVRETIPDNIFDKASEVRLVDLPPDDLIGRLNAGKIYLNNIIRDAKDNYFKKSNLIALRELTLKAMANRVEGQAKLQRLFSVNEVENTHYGMLLLLENPTSKEAIREALRMSKAFSCDLHCVYIDEHPIFETEDELSKLLFFAKSLGAKTSTLSGDFPYCVKDYINSHNLNIIVLVPKSDFDFKNHSKALSKVAPHLSIMRLPFSVKVPSIFDKFKFFVKSEISNLNGYIVTYVLTLIIAFISFPLSKFIHQTNMIMLYLLLTLFVSVRYGILVATFSSFLTVIVFDLTLVNPIGSFVINDLEYLITFASVLAVGLVSSRLVTHSRTLSRQFRSQAKQTSILYDAAKTLSICIDDMEVFSAITKILKRNLNIDCEFWKVDNQNELLRLKTILKSVDKGVLNFVVTHKKEAGLGTNTFSRSQYLYLPIITYDRVYAILVLKLYTETQWSDKSSSKVIQALISLAIQTLERLISVDEAKQVLMNMEAERLRHSLIQSLSHDLKTPLTAIMTNAELLNKKLELNKVDEAKAASKSLLDSSSRMVKLMTNLLEMAKLQSNQIVLKKEWMPADEIISCALRNVKDQSSSFNIKINIAKDCPFFYVDPVLIDRLVTNILDNALKYCPKGSTIEIVAKGQGDKVTLAINDSGPGFGQIKPQRLFDPFRRGVKESNVFGVGLGLAICKTIARVHESELLALPSKLGGASFVLVMPVVPMPFTEDAFL